MKFFTGVHDVSLAKDVAHAFISVNRLRSKNRRSYFKVKDWIMDSGAFSEIANHGRFRYPVSEYADWINKFASCGNLVMAVAQDYMCEPVMLQKTGLTVVEHQQLTIERYDALRLLTSVYIMPVLQGYQPYEYVEHLKMYGDRLKQGMKVGVGSICKRNGNPHAIVAVLEAIKAERPDLQLHGFGLKKTALENAYILSMLDSADSMAWSMAARRQGRNANSGIEAHRFEIMIGKTGGNKPHQLSLTRQ